MSKEREYDELRAGLTEEVEHALRQENRDLLLEIAALCDELAAMKTGDEDKAKVKTLGTRLTELRRKLPVQLMSEREYKEFLKHQKKVENAKKLAEEKALRASKYGAPKKKVIKGADSKPKFINTTPSGELKNLSAPMAKAYDPPAVESAWDSWWEAQGYYSADAETARAVEPKDKFVMVVPPPNVTGSLHIGHALTCSIQDALCRWHRMTGKHVLWVPGTDHAGIATQAVVERKLFRETGKTRHDFGRDSFLKEVWKWKEMNGSRILSQFRRLGASLDHSRTVFTMDEVRSKCVTEAFVRMYEDGLIYRETRLVNWSSALNTALSDIEVDHMEVASGTKLEVKGHEQGKKYEFGTLTKFAYKVADASGNPTDEEVVVATTRLETMLGDSAVAVNPKDSRYSHLHNSRLVHPFRNCTIPVVCDSELVDMSFGTGAVKITPAHDPNDFKCGKKHNLEFISILNDNGSINGVCGEKFEGMMRYDCRDFVLEEMKRLDLFRGIEPYDMTIPICSRSGDIIEPRLIPQWWVSTKDMAKNASDKVRSGELKIVPDSHEKTWFGWLDNSLDWCISRQLWWGHRIPAYRICGGNDSEKWFVGRTEQEAREKAAASTGMDPSSIVLERDEDVLDTWFSSGLFPFSSFGWSLDDEKSMKELEAFYPGSLLETGHDILFFWVARMVMMSLQLNGKLPFDCVYLHAMVRDKYGRKMSKSVGNVIDPIQVIEGITLELLQKGLESSNLRPSEIKKAKEGQKLDYPDGIPECGADALRFGLLAYTSQGRDVNLDISRVAAYRRFCNKWWQLSTFILSNLGDEFQPKADFLSAVVDGSCEGLQLKDRWILSRLGGLVAECNRAFASFDFSTATTAIYVFFLDELCDVYVEAVKPVIYRSEKDSTSLLAAKNSLWTILDVVLRLVHPIMPFVSEELWQRLPGKSSCRAKSIMIEHYPGAPLAVKHANDKRAAEETRCLLQLRSEETDKAYELVKRVAAGMRSLAASFNVSNSKNLHFYVKPTLESVAPTLTACVDDLKVLARAAAVDYLVLQKDPPHGCTSALPEPGVQVFLQLQGIVDPKKEIEELTKRVLRLSKELDGLESRLTSPNFVKMKAVAQENLRKQHEETKIKMESLRDQIALFEKYV